MTTGGNPESTSGGKSEFLEVADFQIDEAHTRDPWSFEVKSYQMNITSATKPFLYNYAAGILITDNEQGHTGDGQKHAVLQFYWENADVPPAGVPNASGLLHLNYSVSEYAGIVELLKGSGKLRCYYKKDQGYGGLVQLDPTSRS
jgi:hypothetical protein